MICLRSRGMAVTRISLRSYRVRCLRWFEASLQKGTHINKTRTPNSGTQTTSPWRQVRDALTCVQSLANNVNLRARLLADLEHVSFDHFELFPHIFLHFLTLTTRRQTHDDDQRDQTNSQADTQLQCEEQAVLTTRRYEENMQLLSDMYTYIRREYIGKREGEGGRERERKLARVKHGHGHRQTPKGSHNAMTFSSPQYR